LGQVADAHLGAFVHGEVGDGGVIEGDFAGIWPDETDDHIEGGGFAGAIGAEEADNFAGAHGEGDILDDLALAVGFRETLCGENHQHKSTP